MQPKIFCRKFLRNSVLFVGLALSALMARADDSFAVDGDAINSSIGGQSKRCVLDVAPSYAVESADNQALIVSARGYVSIFDLKNCKANVPLHVSEIPSGVGALSDINLSKGLYVALDFAATQPKLYLATVAKIGSKKNLVSLGGAYVEGKSIDQLKSTAFSVSEDVGSSTISPDGRYVAPSGQIDCSDDAYPGVWDIQKNKKVSTDRDSCNKLFPQGN